MKIGRTARSRQDLPPKTWTLHQQSTIVKKAGTVLQKIAESRQEIKGSGAAGNASHELAPHFSAKCSWLQRLGAMRDEVILPTQAPTHAVADRSKQK